MDTMIYNYLNGLLEDYATELMNRLIDNLKLEATCIAGECYYRNCDGRDCKIQYCKYKLLTNDHECYSNKSDLFKLDLITNNIFQINNDINNENNEIELFNQIRNK